MAIVGSMPQSIHLFQVLSSHMPIEEKYVEEALINPPCSV